jgi:hypothetical protein
LRIAFLTLARRLRGVFLVERVASFEIVVLRTARHATVARRNLNGVLIILKCGVNKRIPFQMRIQILKTAGINNVGNYLSSYNSPE